MTTELLLAALVSSSRAWRDRIMALLREADGITCEGMAETLAELGQLTPAPDVAILDGGDAGVAEGLSGEIPAIPLVLLSDHPEREVAKRMLPAGAVAILAHDPPASHLVAALYAAAGGLVALSPAHAVDLTNGLPHADSSRRAEWIAPLTPRELQILRMLSEGAANKSIAVQLQISEHTAKFHVGQILAKLGAESRTEAVTIGIRHGLIMV